MLIVHMSAIIVAVDYLRRQADKKPIVFLAPVYINEPLSMLFKNFDCEESYYGKPCFGRANLDQMINNDRLNNYPHHWFNALYH